MDPFRFPPYSFTSSGGPPPPFDPAAQLLTGDPTAGRRCLECAAWGRECYFIEGFSSCIPCSASGQSCSSVHPPPPTTTSAFHAFSTPPMHSTGYTPPSTTAAPPLFPAIAVPPPPLLTEHLPYFPAIPSNASGSPDPLAVQLSGGSSLGGAGPFSSSSAPAGFGSPPKAHPNPSTEEQPPPAKKRKTSPAGSQESGSLSGRSRASTSSSKRATHSPPSKRKADALSTSAPAALPSTSRASPASSRPAQQPALPLAIGNPVAPSGAEAQVIAAEAIRALASELLEESFRIRPEGWGMGHFLVHDMRSEFERVGRVMKRMGPVAEAVISIRVAWGATATMHPAIVPSSVRPDARVLFKGDLRVFGKERQNALTTLAGQASKLTEDLGALEVPTYRNIGLLCELALLLARRQIGDSKRYVRAAVGHWRKLTARKRHLHLSPSEANICFGLVYLDAVIAFFHSARTHQPGLPELSDEEVVLIVGPSGVPGPAWVKPDWFADMAVPSWTELPVTDISDVIEASNCASYRMLSILQSASARTDGGSRVPPATYQKVVDTLLRQLPSLHKVRTRWSEPLSPPLPEREDQLKPYAAEVRDDTIASFVCVSEHHAHRAFIYWILSITQAKLAESSYLVPVHAQVSQLVWKDVQRVAHFARKIRSEPPQAASYWGTRAQVLSGWMDLLPGQQAYLAQYVKEGPGKLEARRFEADNIYSLLKGAAFFGEEYCDRANVAGDALKKMDDDLGKVFPEDYRVNP